MVGLSGIGYGASFNYAYHERLFTLRFNGLTHLQTRLSLFTPVTAVPFFTPISQHNETALLYGSRIVEEGKAYSFSAGVSFNNRSIHFVDYNSERVSASSHYPGLPFEVNVMLFKKRKARYRLYGFIPVGKPTGFGNSVGLKFYGNI